MSKSFTPKVGAKETPTTHRKSTSKVSAKKAHPTHRKPTSQVAAEKASNAHRKETPKVATETVRGTHRKVAAKFQEFRARKVAAKFQEFRAPQKPHAMPAFAEGGLNEIRATAVPASAKGRWRRRARSISVPRTLSRPRSRVGKIASTRLDRGPWRSTERSWTLQSVTSVPALILPPA